MSRLVNSVGLSSSIDGLKDGFGRLGPDKLGTAEDTEDVFDHRVGPQKVPALVGAASDCNEEAIFWLIGHTQTSLRLARLATRR